VRRERDYVITDSKKNTKIVMRGGGGRGEEGGVGRRREGQSWWINLMGHSASS
jgi:hypothetical protein